MKFRNVLLGAMLGLNVMTSYGAVTTAGATTAIVAASTMSAGATIANTVSSNMMNTQNSVVIDCRLISESIFGGKPSLKDTIEDGRCQWNKRAMEELNNTRYEFGEVKGIFDVRGTNHIMIELIEVK